MQEYHYDYSFINNDICSLTTKKMTKYRSLDLRDHTESIHLPGYEMYAINLPMLYDSKIAIKRCFRYWKHPAT